MAEGIFNALAKKRGMRHVHAFSAGLFAFEGGKASSNAIDVMKSHGMDISSHRTKGISSFRLDDMDLIIAMTRQQLFDIMMSNHKLEGKAMTLSQWGFDDEGLDVDIQDPFGANKGEYERVFSALLYFVGSALDRLGEGGGSREAK
jgi:protein-tyrosine-phosphatase